jgi:cytochrome c oxidase subunit I
VNAAGGSSYLWENLFWFFGHPEVYLLALPGMGILLELLPVFTRKPLWGYRVAVAGMVGISLLSFTVWQHHLFVSGMSADLRSFYVLSTEMISIPTGLIFVCALGTLWRGRVRLTVPMLFCLAWIFNFFIGGITGIYLSDAPTNTTDHGSFFVIAHFHYTIMGGLIFALFGGMYFWLPKMTGRMLNQFMGKVHFWLMFLAFNSTFLPLFAAGMLGQPRRAIDYPHSLTFLNEWASVSAWVLGFSMLIFLANVAYSLVIARIPAEENPWASSSLEWQTASPPPAHNFDVIPRIGVPHVYGVEVIGAGAKS